MSENETVVTVKGDDTGGNVDGVDITKRDLVNAGIVAIRGNGVPNVLEIYIRHPKLADVIRGMPRGNYYIDKYADIYKSLLVPVTGAKGMNVTYPGVYSASKIFEKGADFDFLKPPRGILVMNPDRLEAGFALTIELKTPVPQDALRRWGQQVKDGCNDIIAASKPFKMEWITRAVEKGTGGVGAK